MNTLNIINKSPFEKRTLEQCVRRIGTNDSILLIEDATVAAISNTACETLLGEAKAANKVFVLQPDLQARGLSDAALSDGVETVDYAGFVELVVGHDRVHSWL